MDEENQATAIFYILDHIKHARFDAAGWGQPHLTYYKYEPDGNYHYLVQPRINMRREEMSP